MAINVEIALLTGLGGGQDQYFTLDDPTRGVLDNTSYLYAYFDVFATVTSDVRRLSVNRGRSQELDRVNAGQCTIELNNHDRLYDPVAGTAVTPYGGNIVPRKAVRVDVDGLRIFTGQVEDWGFTYQVGGDSLAQVEAVDGFALLGQAELVGGTFTSELTGARMGTVLSQAKVAWPLNLRNIATGQATLAADAVQAGANALQYLQQVELSEPGLVFMNTGGTFTFRDRTYRNTAYYVDQTATGGTIGVTTVNWETYRTNTFTTAGTQTLTPTVSPLRSVQRVRDRVNLLTNPSFETNASGWFNGQSGGVTRSTSFARYGVASGLTTMSSTIDSNAFYFNATFTVTGTFTVSAYVYIPIGSSLAGRTIAISFEGGTATGTQGTSSAATLVAGSWVRASRPFTVTGTGITAPVFRLSGTLSTAVGQTIYIDGVLCERTSELRPYFDGGLYDDNTVVSATTGWTGTANNSTSTATVTETLGDLSGAQSVVVDSGLNVVMRFPSRVYLGTATLAFTDVIGSGIPYTSIEVEYGTEQLHNRIRVTYPSGTSVAEDATSQGAYGVVTRDFQTLLSSSTQGDDMAGFLLGKYKDPRLRVRKLGIMLSALAPADKASVLGLDLGDVVRVVFTPNKVGSAINRVLVVDGISHDIEPRAATSEVHRMMLTLSATETAFILDDSSFGVLDGSNGYGF